MIDNPLVHIYTGDGKGKTTAAFGLAFRASGNGNRTLIYQFLKPASLELSERKAAKDCSLPIEIRAMDTSWDMRKSLDEPQTFEKTSHEIKHILRQLAAEIRQGDYDMIILDEIVFCQSKGLVSIEDVRAFIEECISKAEIVMTGRGATDEIIELADVVSEIKAVKHPYDRGINARKGIEY